VAVAGEGERSAEVELVAPVTGDVEEGSEVREFGGGDVAFVALDGGGESGGLGSDAQAQHVSEVHGRGGLEVEGEEDGAWRGCLPPRSSPAPPSRLRLTGPSQYRAPSSAPPRSHLARAQATARLPRNSAKPALGVPGGGFDSRRLPRLGEPSRTDALVRVAGLFTRAGFPGLSNRPIAGRTIPPLRG
jgi:hypothetical protein